MLLSMNAFDINEQAGDFKFSPLMILIFKENYEGAKLFIENNADVNIRDINNNTPFVYMLKYSKINEEIYKLLIDHGAFIDYELFNNQDFINTIIQNSLFIKFFINKEIKIKYKDNDETVIITEPLIFSINTNNYQFVEVLIKNNININEKDKDNNNPLSIANKINNKEIIELLLKYYKLSTEDEFNNEKNRYEENNIINNNESLLNMESNSMNKINENIEISGFNGEYDINLYKINNNNTDVNKINNNNIKLYNSFYNDQLLMAIKNNSIKNAILMIQNGANVNFENKNGLTPLLYAIYKNNIKFIDLLISYGVKVDVINKNGVSPIKYAIKLRNKDIIKALISQSAKYNEENSDYCKLLNQEVNNENILSIDYLINNTKVTINEFEKKINKFKNKPVLSNLSIFRYLSIKHKNLNKEYIQYKYSFIDNNINDNNSDQNNNNNNEQENSEKDINNETNNNNNNNNNNNTFTINNNNYNIFNSIDENENENEFSNNINNFDDEIFYDTNNFDDEIFYDTNNFDLDYENSDDIDDYDDIDNFHGIKNFDNFNNFNDDINDDDDDDDDDIDNFHGIKNFNNFNNFNDDIDDDDDDNDDGDDDDDGYNNIIENNKNNENSTTELIFLLIKNNNCANVKKLINKNNINIENEDGINIVTFLVSNPKNYDNKLFEYLIDNGAYFNKNIFNNTSEVIFKKNFINYLLNKKLKIKLKPEEEPTLISQPLRFLIKNRNYSYIKRILKVEKKNNSSDIINDDPFLIRDIVKEGNFKALKALIGYINLNQKFENGKSLLMYAVENEIESGKRNKEKNSKIIIEMLLNNNININEQDNNGETALFYAVKKKNINTIKYLVEENNADINIINNKKENVLFPAVKTNKTAIVEYLLPKVENKNSTNNENNTILYYATKQKIIKLLNKFGITEKKGEKII
eukprot:jgi/Orpsp1_1/1176222/evm.model.c7180000056847.1